MTLNKLTYSIIFYLAILLLPLNAQLTSLNNTDDQKSEALNNYVYFINESIHGMLIVHRLLENFNLEINKYVDLDSYQINFYSNKDLPADIFEDPDNWFYDISPYEWYDRIENNETLDSDLRKKLNADASFLKNTIREINRKRFIIEDLINTLDLTIESELRKVYDELESSVVLFEEFYKGQQRLESLVYADSRAIPNHLAPLSPIYKDLRSALESIRDKNDNEVRIRLKKLSTCHDQFILDQYIRDYGYKKNISFHIKNFNDQTVKAISSLRDFRDGKAVPEDYMLYGRYYFYYNSDVINKFNRYGSGIVFEINSLLDILSSDAIRLTELPHYYKVIYPRKLERIDNLATNAKTIESIPLALEGRKIQKNENGTIKVTSEVMKVEVYDHMLQDGDIVSLNFNGEWVLKRHTLTSKPLTLNLKLNSDGKNYLVLHAENLGGRPPNTMALSYFVDGKRQQYIMQSDMNTSEVIEIITN